MQLARYISGSTQIAGVELILPTDGSPEIRTVLLFRKGNKVQRVSAECITTSLADLKLKLPDGVSVALAISGAGIIHRSFSQPLPAGSHKIHAVLPAANTDDFYLQEFGNEQCTFISLARKSLIDDILAELHSNMLPVISLSLGPFAIDLILPQLEDEGTPTRQIGCHALTVDKGSITAYQWVESATPGRSIALGRERINDGVLVAWSAAFQVIAEAEVASVPIKEVIQNRIAHKDKETYKRTGKLLLVSFLLILLCNFLLFLVYSPYSSALPANTAKSPIDLERLRSDVAIRESLLQKFGWQGNAGISYLADQIAASVPDGIRLTLLSLNPIDEQRTRQDRMLVFQNGVIQIAGNCKEVNDLNQWIGQLKELPFSAVVTVTSYQFNEREEVGDFMLSVTTQ